MSPPAPGAAPVPALAVRGLRKTFFPGSPSEVRALQGVDLVMPAGAFLIVIGTNGSGKSTLLNAVAGSFPPDEGAITIAGQDVTRWSESARARLVGRVFQNPFAGTAPAMTVAENFAIASRRGLIRGLGLALGGAGLRRYRDEIATLKMGLEDRLGSPIGSLSGGQRQALTLLMAALNQPRLLLLDEHTAALDPKSADQVLLLSRMLIERHGLTTLMVTHSMQQACLLGDRLLMMHRGRPLHQFAGAEKRRLRPDELLARFEEVRRLELLDEGAALLLAESYR